MEPNDFAQFNFKSYNDPKGGENQLGKVGYSTEQFYSVAGEVNVPQRPVWFNITNNWLHLASHLHVSNISTIESGQFARTLIIPSIIFIISPCIGGI